MATIYLEDEHGWIMAFGFGDHYTWTLGKMHQQWKQKYVDADTVLIIDLVVKDASRIYQEDEAVGFYWAVMKDNEEQPRIDGYTDTMEDARARAITAHEA